VGALGFLVLTGRLLFPRRTGGRFALLDALSVLSAAAVLVGTISGFGAIFNYALFDWIRAYNRISVYIAFFSLFAAAWLLEAAFRTYVHSTPAKVLYHSLLGVVLILGVLDVTSDLDVPPYAPVKQAYMIDELYVRSVEAAVPPGTMVFQLPYLPFPEGAAAQQVQGYDHFRAFLHSRTLRWSFGAMKGREWDLWQEDLAARPLKDAVARLSFAGFGGIHVDRRGYADGGLALEQRLSDLLGSTPVISADCRYAFYDMAGYNEQQRASCTEAEWQEKEDQALHPVLLAYAGGFYDRSSRWCTSKGQMVLFNHGRRPRVVSLEAAFHSVLPDPVELRIEGPLFAETLSITNQSRHFSRVVTVPPGDHRICLECDGPKVIPLYDTRSLVFRVESVKLAEIE
jgi:phosphoglycerol transferase